MAVRCKYYFNHLKFTEEASKVQKGKVTKVPFSNHLESWGLLGGMPLPRRSPESGDREWLSH